jgi:hypothetical protein
MSASARAAESTFDRTVPGRNNAALDAGSEPMFYGIPRRHCFTTALESLQTQLRARLSNRHCRVTLRAAARLAAYQCPLRIALLDPQSPPAISSRVPPPTKTDFDS